MPKTDVPHGTLDLLILKTLETMGPMHGYAIARRIEQMAGTLTRLVGIDLSRIDSPRAAAPDRHEVGHLRDEPESEVLRRDESRIETAPGRSGELGKVHGARGQISRGEVVTMWQRLARVAALVRVRRLDGELDREIEAHLEMAERDALARGLSPEDARRDARLSFGGIAQVREAHRDDRSARWIETFLKDFGYGLASLLRHRSFAAVSIGVLALGIGAATAMFSLVDSVLLRSMPYPEPERIVRIWEAPTPATVNQTTNGFFHEWRRRSRSFEAMAAERPTHFNLTIGGEPVPAVRAAGYGRLLQRLWCPRRHRPHVRPRRRSARRGSCPRPESCGLADEIGRRSRTSSRAIWSSTTARTE